MKCQQEKRYNIPCAVDKVYKNGGWISWGDFLGTDNISTINTRYREFEKAREYIRSLEIKNVIEWRRYCTSGNKPKNIPACPHIVYKNSGWGGFSDWLGNNGRKKVEWRSYKKTVEFVKRLSLKSILEWQKYCESGEKPDDIPKTPWSVYKNEWQGWKKFLSFRCWKSYRESRKFARKLELKSSRQWFIFAKSGSKPDNIPYSPQAFYKDKG